MPGTYSGYVEEEENVYNLIPQPQVVPPKPPMYKSKHSGVIEPKEFELGVSTKRSNASMGLPNGCNATQTTSFLRKHTKEFVLPEPTATSRPKEKVKAPVPSKEDKPVMGLRSDKNFITTNVVEAILSQPKKPEEEFVWTEKSNFGQVPSYLKRNKDKIATEKEQLEEYLRARDRPDNSQVQQMSEDERAELLRHLKTKWASVNTAYQKMTFTLDTPAKKKRKEEYERQLAEIERDIKTLERGEMILVIND